MTIKIIALSALAIAMFVIGYIAGKIERSNDDK